MYAATKISWEGTQSGSRLDQCFFSQKEVDNTESMLMPTPPYRAVLSPSVGEFAYTSDHLYKQTPPPYAAIDDTTSTPAGNGWRAGMAGA